MGFSDAHMRSLAYLANLNCDKVDKALQPAVPNLPNALQKIYENIFSRLTYLYIYFSENQWL